MQQQTTAEGSTVLVDAEFFDDANVPLLPKAGYPKVIVLDTDKDTVFSTVAHPDLAAQGRWLANITIPKLGLTEKVEWRVKWRFLSLDGDRYVDTDRLIITPIVERRASDIVALYDDPDFTFTLPIAYDPDLHVGTLKIYNDNTAITDELDLNGVNVDVATGIDKSTFTVQMPQGGIPVSLPSYLVRMRINVGSKPITFTHKLWSVSPSIVKAMTFMEDFLNKARVENVIPELEYTAGDVMNYLERGLNMFNRLIHTTGFTGTNMQGMLFDAWLVCSCYYGLSSQLLAEGQLAFDFSGQGVSLNVDRTPQLDSALGRIESDMDNRIVPFKKELLKQGIVSGDGSVGATSMRNPRAFGSLGLTNAPTTRINGIALGAYGRVFRRW